MPYFSFPASALTLLLRIEKGVHDEDRRCRWPRRRGRVARLEAMERWPQHITPRTDGRPSLKIEGRHYPEDQGPGAGCPPEHGLSRVDGHQLVVGRRRAAGRRPRPHRHHGALSELRPLRAEPRGSRIRRRLRAPLQRVDRRLLHADQGAAARRRRHADRARPCRDRHHARGEDARAGRDDAAAGAEDAQSRPPRSRRVLQRRRGARHAARHPRRAGHPPAEDRRRPLHQLHPGALHQLSRSTR